jgi:hypothetical protein
MNYDANHFLLAGILMDWSLEMHSLSVYSVHWRSCAFQISVFVDARNDIVPCL